LVAIVLAWLAGIKAIDALVDADGWATSAILALSAVTVAAVRYAWLDEKKHGPLMVKSPHDLLPENKKWLAESGHMVIVTRDMSWILDEALNELVSAKAANGDLTIVAARRTAAFQAWEALGATIALEPQPPSVRFAVLRHGTSDARVLITRQRRGAVEVREYTPDDFPVYGLCMDILNSTLPKEQGVS
jgi:hypothetical protein